MNPKFRQAIIDKEGKFLEWFYWGFIDGDFISPAIQSNGIDTRKESQMFTGLKDKNGKDVYEGDILQWSHLKSSSPVEVYYNDSEFVFVGRPVDRSEETESWLNNTCEVIGNIYENP